MIGFKAFDKNLKCRDFQYEIGHTYEFDGKPIVCKQGKLWEDECKSKHPVKEALDMAIKALEQEPCEDTISRQMVKEQMIKYGFHAPDMTVTEFVEDELTPVTPQPKAEWVPVNERLPKAGEYVEGVAKYYLVQNKYGDMLVARYTHSRYWEQIYQLEPIEDEIVAWMPLPKPYKAESEE